MSPETQPFIVYLIVYAEWHRGFYSDVEHLRITICFAISIIRKQLVGTHYKSSRLAFPQHYYKHCFLMRDIIIAYIFDSILVIFQSSMKRI